MENYKKAIESILNLSQCQFGVELEAINHV